MTNASEWIRAGGLPDCPQCNRPLVSRMALLCSWCGARVPDELRFSPQEIQRIEAEEAAARKEREAARDSKKKRKKRNNTNATPEPNHFGEVGL